MCANLVYYEDRIIRMKVLMPEEVNADSRPSTPSLLMTILKLGAVAISCSCVVGSSTGIQMHESEFETAE